MTAKLIDGKAFAATVREKVASHVTRLKEDHGITPGLAVVLVGGGLFGALSPNGQGCLQCMAQHPILCSQTMRVCLNDAVGWPRKWSVWPPMDQTLTPPTPSIP